MLAQSHASRGVATLLDFGEQVRDMGICEVLSAPRSPWQRAYVERVIGSIRRECLDHVIVFNENLLRRTLNSYFDYYHRSRTHLSLGKDSPEGRDLLTLFASPRGMASEAGRTEFSLGTYLLFNSLNGTVKFKARM